MTPRILLLAAFAGLLLVGTAPARTWYVAADGSGDASTIAAAVDSSSSGDVILVGPGTHYVSDAAGGGVLLKAGTSLISESGPAATFLKPGSAPAQPGLISMRDNCVVSGFSVLGFGVVGAIAPLYIDGDHAEVRNNIIDGASAYSAIMVGAAFSSIHHNVCFGGVGPGAIVLSPSEGTNIFNNVVLGGIHADFCPLSVQIHCNLINGSMSTCPFRFNNFSGDPLFCGPDNYYLHSDSPCSPGNHPDGIDCGLIGPLPVGCGPVSTEETTWGAVKALYRD
jgi:hypothetical protein